MVTGAVTAYGMVLCWRMVRSAGAGEGAGNLVGASNFLGQFGLITAEPSLALILLEGSFVFFIHPCA